MKINGLLFCTVFTACLLPSIAFAQGSWQFESYAPVQGYPVSTGNGIPSSGGILGSQNFTYSTTASAGGTTGDNSSSCTLEDTVTYEWLGGGTPTSSFHVDVTPSASCSVTINKSTAGNSASGSASTNPSSTSALSY
jgi:hypothetical protein